MGGRRRVLALLARSLWYSQCWAPTGQLLQSLLAQPWLPGTGCSWNPRDPYTGTVGLHTAGTVRSHIAGAVRPRIAGAVGPGNAGVVEPGIAAAVEPDTAGVVEPGTVENGTGTGADDWCWFWRWPL